MPPEAQEPRIVPSPSKPERDPNPERQLTQAFARFAAPRAKLARALRTKLRARLPGLVEVVYEYERQEAVVVAYSPSGKGYDAACSLRISPTEARLYFADGPRLARIAPRGLLHGSGSKVRYVELASAADLGRPEIEALIVGALEHSGAVPDPRVESAIVTKGASQKERAARRVEKRSSTATRRSKAK